MSNVTNSEYVITLTDGTVLCRVPENTIDTTSSAVSFIGKGITDYGESQNTNFVRILEHFASAKSPVNPVRGQIWFRKHLNTLGQEQKTFDLLIYNISDGTITPEGYDNGWKKITIIEQGDEEPLGATTGTIWYNTHEKVLYIYDSEKQQWIASGSENILHTNNIYKELLTPPDDAGIAQTVNYTIPNELIIRDLRSDIEVETGVVSKGVTNVITYMIIGKEVYDDSQSIMDDSPRSIVVKGEYIVQSIKELNGTYTLHSLGGCIVNTLGISTGCDKWKTAFEIYGTDVIVKVTADTKRNSHIVWLLNIKVQGV